VLPGISSTHVRNLLASRNSDPQATAELKRVVPQRVLEWIEAHGLYT
jgi:hypothetical protein